MGRMGRKRRWAWLLYGPRGPQCTKGGWREEKGGTEASPRRVKVKLKVKVEDIEQLTDRIRETTVLIHTRTMHVPDQCDRLTALIF